MYALMYQHFCARTCVANFLVFRNLSQVGHLPSTQVYSSMKEDLAFKVNFTNILVLFFLFFRLTKVIVNPTLERKTLDQDLDRILIEPSRRKTIRPDKIHPKLFFLKLNW